MTLAHMGRNSFTVYCYDDEVGWEMPKVYIEIFFLSSKLQVLFVM